MVEINNKELCCGCTACAQACPKFCISMQADDEGFIYPSINKSQCINCSICEKVCPIINQNKTTTPLRIYAGWNKSTEKILTSSSGGVFSALAEETIKQGGIIFGASFNSNNELIHSKTNNLTELEKFKGSKYLQSNINNTYKEVYELLKLNKKILFVGTPCQISGLKKYLKKDYSNLLTVDFICHGVPSPMIFKKHIKYIIKKIKIEDQKKLQIKNINFRNKDEGWRKYNLKIKFHRENKSFTYKKNFHNDLFLKAFLANFTLRPSCYNCSFKSFKSKSDITLSDFWGGGKLFTKKENLQGISSIFINTEKGINYIKQINSLILHEVSYKEAYQETIDFSPKIPKNRDKFWNEIQSGEYEEIMKRYTKVSKIQSFNRLTIKALKKVINLINR